MKDTFRGESVPERFVVRGWEAASDTYNGFTLWRNLATGEERWFSAGPPAMRSEGE